MHLDIFVLLLFSRDPKLRFLIEIKGHRDDESFLQSIIKKD